MFNIGQQFEFIFTGEQFVINEKFESVDGSNIVYLCSVTKPSPSSIVKSKIGVESRYDEKFIRSKCRLLTQKVSESEKKEVSE